MQIDLKYLVELRQRLLKSVMCIVLFFIPLFIYANTLFYWLARPLLQHLKGSMIAVNVMSPLIIPIELAAKTAFLISVPYLLYQLWTFISPALYRREKKMDKWLIECECYFVLFRYRFLLLGRFAFYVWLFNVNST